MNSIYLLQAKLLQFIKISKQLASHVVGLVDKVLKPNEKQDSNNSSFTMIILKNEVKILDINDTNTYRLKALNLPINFYLENFMNKIRVKFLSTIVDFHMPANSTTKLQRSSTLVNVQIMCAYQNIQDIFFIRKEYFGGK